MAVDLKKIPKTPGIYKFFHNSEIIYIGKAKNLKKRVSSYFGNSKKDRVARHLGRKLYFPCIFWIVGDFHCFFLACLESSWFLYVFLQHLSKSSWFRTGTFGFRIGFRTDLTSQSEKGPGRPAAKLGPRGALAPPGAPKMGPGAPGIDLK